MMTKKDKQFCKAVLKELIHSARGMRRDERETLLLGALSVINAMQKDNNYKKWDYINRMGERLLKLY